MLEIHQQTTIVIIFFLFLGNSPIMYRFIFLKNDYKGDLRTALHTDTGTATDSILIIIIQ